MKNMLKIVPAICAAVALTACNKQLDIPVQVQTVDASNVVLMTRIDGETAEGDPVRLKETKHDGCSFLGTITKDFGIHVTMVECGDKVTINRRANFNIALSRTHTFMDVNGQVQAGYGAGDKFNVPDAGVDWPKLFAELTASTKQQ